MKFKVLFILTGVVIMHIVILTGVCLTGGCNSTPVLRPRPFIPAPESQSDEIMDEKIIDENGSIPKVTITTETVTPVVTPVPPAFKLDTPSQRITYIVKKNDSFWKIARNHGVTMQSLASYNNMPLTKVLRVGQKLNIPPGGYVVKNIKPIRPSSRKKLARGVKRKLQTRPADGVYTVKSGDSFWKIAKKYNLKTKTLLEANNMAGKETLRIGQKLVIPDNKSAAAPAAPAVSAADTNPKTSVKSILDTIDDPEDVKINDNTDSKVIDSKALEKVVKDNNIDEYDNSDRAVKVIKDIRVEDFAKQYKITPAILKQLNDDYPANGVFKAGSVVIVRSTE